jgi:hypothetical protein
MRRGGLFLGQQPRQFLRGGERAGQQVVLSGPLAVFGHGLAGEVQGVGDVPAAFTGLDVAK